MFGESRDIVTKRIGQYSVTNISATPTFYRMLLPIDHEYPSVKRITFGGERFDASLAEDMKQMFPNAKPRNIYASTEAGSVLESTSDRFKITDPERCRIEDGRLFIHNSLLGEYNTEDGWAVSRGNFVHELQYSVGGSAEDYDLSIAGTAAGMTICSLSNAVSEEWFQMPPDFMGASFSNEPKPI